MVSVSVIVSRRKKDEREMDDTRLIHWFGKNRKMAFVSIAGHVHAERDQNGVSFLPSSSVSLALSLCIHA